MRVISFNFEFPCQALGQYYVEHGYAFDIMKDGKKVAVLISADEYDLLVNTTKE